MYKYIYIFYSSTRMAGKHITRNKCYTVVCPTAVGTVVLTNTQHRNKTAQMWDNL